VTLLAVPNVSEGRDAAIVRSLARAFDGRLLAVNSDPDHHRSVFTLAGEPGQLAAAVLDGALATIAAVDLSAHSGLHPRVGALDVAPIVYLSDAGRGAAFAEVLVLADLLGEHAELPVFLYGELAGGRTRAALRRGGPEALASRIAAGELAPDFGPRALHRTAGAVLVAARPPLVAFNVELAPPAGVDDARAIAGRIRESAPTGLPGVRAIGLWLAHRAVAQVSMNLERFGEAGPVEVVEAIARDADPVEAELIGVAPRAAFDGFPRELPVRNLVLLEDALARVP
jgi:glutamate formiminotransferase / 5-formyltetrahydrofolate cyclo-ligase